MAGKTIVLIAAVFVGLVSGYYPVTHSKNPFHLPPMCHPPIVHPGCSYKPNFVTWHVGQKITFYCPPGHKMIGYGYAKCTKYGKWDNDSPKCIPKLCYLPKLYGKVSIYQSQGYQKFWKVGQKIKFQCPYGYKLKGTDYAVCTDYGKWSYDPPVCVKIIACYLPKLKDNCGYGPYNKKSWNVGEKISFHCPTGYDLKGSDYAVCSYDGSWSNDSPYCHKRVVCQKPVLTPYCDYKPKYQATWYPGQKVSFVCPYGYQLYGSAYATCTYYGKWSNPSPICKKKAVYCKAPPLPTTCHCKMSTLYKQYYAVGELARFSCQYGYKLSGYGIAKCMYNGHWSHPIPVCIKKTPFNYGYGFLTNLWH